jgi:hypothetical protein
MTLAFFIAAMLAALVVIAAQLPKRHGYLTYPLLVAVFYLTWLAPQLVPVVRDPFMPRDGLSAMSVMVLLSLLALVVGWSIGCDQALRRLRARGAELSPSVAALIGPTAALTAVGFGARVVLGGLRLDPELTNQWTGPIVIVATIAGLRIIPLFLSLTMVLRERTPVTVGLAAANFFLCASFAFVDIGRSEAIDLVLVSLLALWFARRIRIGLPVLAAGCAAIGLFAFAVGELRTASADYFDQTGQRVSIFNPMIWRQVDFGAATEKAADGAPDIRNAVYLMSLRQGEGGYSLGARLWDDLVFRWVPAQIVGADRKAALMFESDLHTDYDEIGERYNYKRIGGTTSTGFGVAFGEFWHLGAILFGLLGWAAARWWTLGQAGDLWAQVMYASTLGSGLIAFTHSVYWVWLNLPLLFAGLVFVKAWLRAAHRRAPGRAGPPTLPLGPVAGRFA